MSMTKIYKCEKGHLWEEPQLSLKRRWIGEVEKFCCPTCGTWCNEIADIDDHQRIKQLELKNKCLRADLEKTNIALKNVCKRIHYSTGASKRWEDVYKSALKHAETKY